jgi:hypothetical protein
MVVLGAFPLAFLFIGGTDGLEGAMLAVICFLLISYSPYFLHLL